MTSEDLKAVYRSLLQLQKSCGCESIDSTRIGCRKFECVLCENGRCPITPLKQTILRVEGRRARERLIKELEEDDGG